MSFYPEPRKSKKSMLERLRLYRPERLNRMTAAKLVAHNTLAYAVSANDVEPARLYFRFHHTDILTYDLVTNFDAPSITSPFKSGENFKVSSVKVETGGWNTKFTRRRINKYLLGAHVWCERGEMRIGSYASWLPMDASATITYLNRAPKLSFELKTDVTETDDETIKRQIETLHRSLHHIFFTRAHLTLDSKTGLLANARRLLEECEANTYMGPNAKELADAALIWYVSNRRDVMKEARGDRDYARAMLAVSGETWDKSRIKRIITRYLKASLAAQDAKKDESDVRGL